MKSFAIILSGGTGARFGGALPKQFTKLAGRAIIEYTVDVFDASKDIDEIYIVSQPAHVSRTWDIIKSNNWTKVTKVITGGKERFDSTYSALQALADQDPQSRILFHDAVRPLVDARIIADCVSALAQFEAVDVVIPSADTLVQVFDDECIDNIPNRSLMRRGQTPQGFRLESIQSAYQRAFEVGRKTFTCDCGVVRAMLPHVRVATVQGSERNMKVTQSIDLFIAEKLLQSGMDMASVRANDLSRIKGKNLVIFGGSSGIGLEMRNIALSEGAHVEVASRGHNGVDVRDLDGVREYLAEVSEKLGHIDYVVNTAGLLIKKPTHLLTLDEITDLIAINYTGAINVAVAAKPYLESVSGMLLNFTSSSYTRGRAFYTLYSSANAAVVNLTQGLASEWAVDKVRVNCINPERTATPMRRANFGVESPEFLLEPETVAVAALKTLVSDLTGVVVDVRKDGR